MEIVDQAVAATLEIGIQLLIDSPGARAHHERRKHKEASAESQEVIELEAATDALRLQPCQDRGEHSPPHGLPE